MIHNTAFHRTLHLTALLALSSLCACRSGGTAEMTWSGGEAQETRVEGQHLTLENDLQLRSARSERRDGKLFVQLELFNTRYAELSIRWKLDWYDRNGFLIGSPRGWIPTVLAGKETKTISASAPNNDAVSWTLGARRPNTVSH